MCLQLYSAGFYPLVMWFVIVLVDTISWCLIIILPLFYFRAERYGQKVILWWFTISGNDHFCITIFIFAEKNLIMMMWHLLRSVPNKHDFLHLENKTVALQYTSFYCNAVCHILPLSEKIAASCLKPRTSVYIYKTWLLNVSIITYNATCEEQQNLL